jgi:hypothetical protein
MWPVFLIGGALLALLVIPRRASASGEATPVDDIKRDTRGLRNRNPGNLRYFASIAWQGQTGQDGDGYAVFDSDLHGLRAALIDLNTGFVRDHEDTVAAIIPEWAPKADKNPTAAYIEFVRKRLNVSANQRLTYATHAVPLLRAIVAFENGRDPFPASLYADAFRAAGK